MTDKPKQPILPDSYKELYLEVITATTTKNETQVTNALNFLANLNGSKTYNHVLNLLDAQLDLFMVCIQSGISYKEYIAYETITKKLKALIAYYIKLLPPISQEIKDITGQ